MGVGSGARGGRRCHPELELSARSAFRGPRACGATLVRTIVQMANGGVFIYIYQIACVFRGAALDPVAVPLAPSVAGAGAAAAAGTAVGAAAAAEDLVATAAAFLFFLRRGAAKAVVPNSASLPPSSSLASFVGASASALASSAATAAGAGALTAASLLPRKSYATAPALMTRAMLLPAMASRILSFLS